LGIKENRLPSEFEASKRIIIIKPIFSKRAILYLRFAGRNITSTLLPSKGGMGIMLKTPRTILIITL
jgi:hypothetical protein